MAKQVDQAGESIHVRFDKGVCVHRSRELRPEGKPFVWLHRQIDQSGEVFLREGVTYTPDNTPRNATAIHKGKSMPDVASVRKHGDTVEVTQFERDARGKFYCKSDSPFVRFDEDGVGWKPDTAVASRLIIVDAKHFKLKYGIESKRTQDTDNNCATIQALGQIERQHPQSW